MKFKVSIRVDNAAFFNGAEGCEVARILREVADKFDGEALSAGQEVSVRDVNGNKVGEVKVVR